MISPLRKQLAARANFLQKTREFFNQRSVFEVDTGLLQSYSVTDPYMSAFQVIDPQAKPCGYLQTSPEYAMKKLLCHGAGDIYQLSKMFRANEHGPIHASEFTMLEWYRLDFDHRQLIDEVCELICFLVGTKEVQLVTYQQAFLNHLNVDPFEISQQELSRLCEALVGEIPPGLLFDNLLTLLFAEQVETKFDPSVMTVVTDFPASQASLAKITKVNGQLVGERFEVYLAGIELANGFHELTDADQQLERFKQDNRVREKLGLSTIEIDMELITSLNKGLPNCAGVALGLDRLFMISQNKTSLHQVILD
jgi:elongation factor P--(R)-beta-lysine ligase